MIHFHYLLLFGVALYTASSGSFVAEVQMQTNISSLNNAAACDLLKAKARGLWRDGTFQSCFVRNTLEVEPNVYVIVFRIVVLGEHLVGYSEDMPYAAKTGLVNSRLNDDHNFCHTITGTEWMKRVPTLETTFDFKAFYPGNARNATCNTLLNIAHHSLNGQLLIGCDAVVTQTEEENDQTSYFYLRMKILRTSRLLSVDSFRTLGSIAHIINHNGNLCVSVESVTTGSGSRRFTIIISDVGNHDQHDVCNWFVRKYTYAIRTGPFYHCVYRVKLAYRNGIILNLDLNNSLDGIPLDSMSNAEIALRTESLFNSNMDGCISYDVAYLFALFQKGLQNEYCALYFTGPLDEDVCKKVREYYQEDYAEMFSTCDRLAYLNAPQGSGKYSLQVLKSIIPVYLIDYPNYVDSHRKMLYAFNQQGCKYNGFVTHL